jgi:hypothetical protein
MQEQTFLNEESDNKLVSRLINYMNNNKLSVILDLIVFSLLSNHYKKDGLTELQIIRLIITLFGYVLNVYPHRLNQKMTISIMIIIIISYTKETFLNTTIIYLSVLPQVIRLKSYHKIYSSLRRIRIVFGPVYGLSLLWSIFQSKFSIYNDIQILTLVISFIIYICGVTIRPDYEENAKDYFKRRKYHGIFMVISFTLMVIVTSNILVYILKNFIKI